jgi:hypothetical protein
MANAELKKNFVDDEKVIQGEQRRDYPLSFPLQPRGVLQVMSMGFSNVQARLALRVADGHVERAIEYIIKVKSARVLSCRAQ